MYFSAQLIYFYSFIYFILLLGHPYKMFRFPLLHLLWWWVGLLPQKKKKWTLEGSWVPDKAGNHAMRVKGTEWKMEYF